MLQNMSSPVLWMLGVFKNESLNLAEWIDCHAQEGVDRIILVNNNSSDDFQSAIASARYAGRVTLLSDDRIYAQQQIYNDAYKSHIQDSACEWLIVGDLDEFFYSRKSFATIPDYLATVPKDVSLISIPWKMFGSSGFIYQPESGVIQNFTWRDEYPEDCQISRPGMSCPGWMNCKYIVRNASVETLGIHNPVIHDGKAILSNSEPTDKNYIFQPISEPLLATMNIHVNHYPIQSQDYYNAVKRNRGSAASAASTEIKSSMDFFFACDQNIVSDFELKNKRNSQVRLLS